MTTQTADYPTPSGLPIEPVAHDYPAPLPPTLTDAAIERSVPPGQVLAYLHIDPDAQHSGTRLPDWAADMLDERWPAGECRPRNASPLD